MEYRYIIYKKEGQLAWITINRPEVLNAVNRDTLLELKAAFEAAGADRDVGVVVLTGAGRAFSSGVDLKEMGEIVRKEGRVGAYLDDPARGLSETMQGLPRAVIGMVNGFCFTGGLEIALNCDILIAAEEARFGDTHAKWGVLPSWGMSQRLPRLIGVMKAKELSFTSRAISGREAEQLGLVNRAVPLDKLEETVRQLALKIMENSLEAIAGIKSLYNQGLRTTLEQGLKLELTHKLAIGDTAEKLKGFGKKD